MTSEPLLGKFQLMEKEARAALANHQKIAMPPDLLLGLIAAIRASQRPPLGYVVLRGDIEHQEVQLVDQRVWPDLEIAGDAADRAGGTAFELRELQP